MADMHPGLRPIWDPRGSLCSDVEVHERQTSSRLDVALVPCSVLISPSLANNLASAEEVDDDNRSCAVGEDLAVLISC